MKRLTDKFRGLCISCELSIDDECDNLHRGEVCNNAKRYDRLAFIEDILGDDYDLDRLRELVEADRDGRCMVLPCEVGTQVWCIVEVARYGYPDPTFEKQLFLRPFKMEWAGDIGKTKFLTREAAEAALKAREQDR